MHIQVINFHLKDVGEADYRALTTGWFVSPAGRLVATVAQEGLVRLKRQT